MALKVGIDFGTSNSGVAVGEGQQVRLLPLDPHNVTPEVVKTILYITRDQRHYVGQEAVELYYRHNVGRLRRYVKKRVGEVEYMGAEMYYVTDVYTYVDELTPGRLLQFIKTALRSAEYEGTQIFDRYYSISDIVALYLRELKLRTEKALGEPVSGVTLGRPVKFHRVPELDQRAEDSLRAAAHEAGFETVDFEFEPVAAALYYEMSMREPQNVLIFDFGGGTLDITIMRLGEPGNRHVFANGGIDIAGSDFDRAIIQKRMLAHFGKDQVEDLEIVDLINAVSDWMVLPELSVPQARAMLERAIRRGVVPARMKALQSLIFNDLAFSFYNMVEAGKIALSTQTATEIRMDEKDLRIWELYTRFQFEKDIREHRQRIEQVLLDTLAASGLEPAQIGAVVKTGGSSGIPVFHNMLAGLFGEDRVTSSSAFSSVTAGLGLKAGGARVER